MSKNDQQDSKKKNETPEQKFERLRDEIIDEAKEIADGTQQSCYILVTKTQELMAVEKEFKRK